MASQKDVPCRLCGGLMWRGSGSLPPGQATCKPCRSRIARGEPESALTAVPDLPPGAPDTPGGMLASVLTAIEAATWLEEADAPGVELAKQYARKIDEGHSPTVVGPPLLLLMKSLGFTPAERRAMGLEGAKPKSTLASLREAR